MWPCVAPEVQLPSHTMVHTKRLYSDSAHSIAIPRALQFQTASKVGGTKPAFKSKAVPSHHRAVRVSNPFPSSIIHGTTQCCLRTCRQQTGMCRCQDWERFSNMCSQRSFATNRKASSENQKASSEDRKVSSDDEEGFQRSLALYVSEKWCNFAYGSSGVHLGLPRSHLGS